MIYLIKSLKKYNNFLLNIIIFTILILVASDVLASDRFLPYESWLTIIQYYLTGPIATSITLLAFIVSGITLIFFDNEIQGFFKVCVYITLFLSCIFAGAQLVISLFGDLLALIFI